MGIRTDLTSLGAIGLGTAVAVVGTGALLFANGSHHVDMSACVDAPMVAAVAAFPAVPAAPAAPSASAAPSDPAALDVSVEALSEAPVVLEVADAPVVVASAAPKAHRVNVVVTDRFEVRTECVTEMRDRTVDVRVRARAQADGVRARADEARAAADAVRSLADEIRAEAEVIRAEARAGGEVDPDRIQELVEAALADAGIRRGGSWGN